MTLPTNKDLLLAEIPHDLTPEQAASLKNDPTFLLAIQSMERCIRDTLRFGGVVPTVEELLTNLARSGKEIEVNDLPPAIVRDIRRGRSREYIIDRLKLEGDAKRAVELAQ